MQLKSTAGMDDKNKGEFSKCASAMFVRKVRETSLREFVEVVVDRISGDVRVHMVEYFFNIL